MTISIEEVTQLVDEIQQVLIDTNDPYEEELIDLAARHDDCVEQVTKRLGEVEKLLDKGL
jgi:ElaB/YqjD/DUF883 family membrane-anchored ribosome-binding protein